MARQVCSKATDTPLNAKIKKKKGIKQNKMKQNNKEKEKR